MKTKPFKPTLRTALAAFAVAAGALAGAPAHAALLDGKTVGFTYLFPNMSSPYGGSPNGNYVVGAGVEVSPVVDGHGSLDLSDTNILAAFNSSSGFTPSSFNGFRITDVFNTIDDFTSVAINGLTNMAGFDASRVSFDANNIWVNWQGLSFNSNTRVSLDVRGTVPEPGTLALALLGLVGVGAARRVNS